MRLVLASCVAASFALPVFAQDENFEVIGLYSITGEGSPFMMASIRTKLTGMLSKGVPANARNAQEGFRFRFDALKSSYDTNYDATPGTATENAYRFLLSYGAILNEALTVTLTGGLSYHMGKVRPLTASAPDDFSGYGEFFSLDAEYSPAGFGSLQILAEHDGAGGEHLSISDGNFFAGTYLMDIGDSLRLGPTANYILDGDYTRSAIGASAIILLSDQFEVKGTIGRAWPEISGVAADQYNYGEVQVRLSF